MNPMGNPEIEKKFEEAWNRWVARPPRQSPAEAALRVARRACERPARRLPVWLYPAAAAVVILISGITLLRIDKAVVAPSDRPSIQETVPLGEGQVLIWLDRNTPLYMTFQNP